MGISSRQFTHFTNSLIVAGALNYLAVDTKVLMADYAEKCIPGISRVKWLWVLTLWCYFPESNSCVGWRSAQPVQRRCIKGQTKNRIILESTEAHPVLSNRRLTDAFLVRITLAGFVMIYKHKI